MSDERDALDDLQELLDRFDADAHFAVGSESMWSGELRLTLTNPDDAPSRSMTFYSVAANDPTEAARALVGDANEWLATSGVQPMPVPDWRTWAVRVGADE